MTQHSSPPSPDEIAKTVLTALDEHTQVPRFPPLSDGQNISEAYIVTNRLRHAFEARGDNVTGRKIGFTNRDMWETFGVTAPMWGYCTDKTTRQLKNAQVQRVSDFVEPRIEPEIVFGLAADPHPSMNETELLDCIEWISLGYELVQSIYPGWQLAASDAIAANGLHGALLIGDRQQIAGRKGAWQQELASFQIELLCDGKPSQSGGGAMVMGSPLIALQSFVKLLAEDKYNPPLCAGEIITTGTLTLAMPVQAGQKWTTKIQGIPLNDITLRFEP